MQIIRAISHPSGGAVSLRLAVQPTELPLLVATETPTPITWSQLDGARKVAEPGFNLRPVQPEGVMLETSEVQFMALDLHESVGLAAQHYHLFNLNDPLAQPITTRVDATAPSSETHVSHMRTLVRQRLEYHLGRAIDAGMFKVPTEKIPVLQQNSLAKDDPLPCILLNETISPMPSGIGKYRGRGTDATGATYEEYTHRGRSRVDLLVLSESPSERNALAKHLHQCLLNDFTLFTDTGWQGVEPQLSMMSGVTPDGRLQLGESITIDGLVDYVRRVKIHQP
ncbi:hypothetical protein [Deinococcus cellulosilyticus]|uniref:Uncharacterized protein n=1 Tax=Deinococcus cellulosilyticus (strain DSM 18568 / NBRC 106333 / KACC 11606 / 5516J-15) TaxID=1223518 RepID=A0A511N893_DEIC1|nr:hypothetical protein [Deinococcus cellulosilyticus]GEM48696.1 hypothetical protein DC3_43310 [Deinococcus cellulosilyticus NBRC 106333 = KACC 11606]